MKKDKLTWFGFKLTKKQSLNLFIVSIVGSLVLIFILLSMITNWIITDSDYYGYYYYFDDYYEEDYDFDYYMRKLIRMIPGFTIVIILLIISIYSIIKVRKISKSYPDFEPTINSESKIKSKIPLFCPNCGNKISGEENFCIICSQKLK